MSEEKLRFFPNKSQAQVREIPYGRPEIVFSAATSLKVSEVELGLDVRVSVVIK